MTERRLHEALGWPLLALAGVQTIIAGALSTLNRWAALAFGVAYMLGLVSALLAAYHRGRAHAFRETSELLEETQEQIEEQMEREQRARDATAGNGGT